jgi:hypothetical protein
MFYLSNPSLKAKWLWECGHIFNKPRGHNVDKACQYPCFKGIPYRLIYDEVAGGKHRDALLFPQERNGLFDLRLKER